MGGVIALQVRIRWLQSALERFGRDGDSFTLAGFEQHRRIRRRHTDREPRVSGDRSDKQTLKEASGDKIADLLIGQAFARKKSLIPLLAELAIQSLGLR